MLERREDFFGAVLCFALLCFVADASLHIHASYSLDGFLPGEGYAYIIITSSAPRLFYDSHMIVYT